jgi:hypothetical protein
MLLGISVSKWVEGFSTEGPMFWALIVLVLCLVYVRSNAAVAERQAKLEAENARRQEQTYQAMVQHYRQVVTDQQSRMDVAGQQSGARMSPPAAGGVLELFQLIADSSAQKITRLEAKSELLAKELAEAKRDLADQSSTTGVLLANLSDMQHQINNLNHAFGGLLGNEAPSDGRRN